MKIYTWCFLIIFIPVKVLAQSPGSLDSTFDADGKIKLSLNNFDDRAFAICLQQDNKIVVGGATLTTDYDFALVRYNPNGSLDTTFSNDGIVITDFNSNDDKIWALAMQPDNKIVAAGSSQTSSSSSLGVIARFNPDGSIDTSFGNGGSVIFTLPGSYDAAYTVELAAGGKIIAGGSDFSIIRLNPDGTFDNGFSGNGIANSPFFPNATCRSLKLQNDGKIVAGGNTLNPSNDFALARFDTSGMLDSTFNGNGKVTIDIGTGPEGINSVAIQNDGKIIAGGNSSFSMSNRDFVIVRYLTDGSLDSSFGISGKVINAYSAYDDVVDDIAIQADGKIVTVGYTENGVQYNIALQRYHPNGSIDLSFGNNGTIITDFISLDDLAFAAAIQADHKIIVAGETFDNGKWNIALARYHSGLNIGLIDFSKPDMDISIYPNPIKNHAELKYELSKDERLSITLYDLNGRLMKTFVDRSIRSKGQHAEDLIFSESLPAGNYILQVDNVKAQQSIKIIKL